MADSPGHGIVFDLIDESRRFIDQLIDENARLSARLVEFDRAEAGENVAALRERARTLEVENEKLANLYVASCRLSGSEGLIPTLEVVREVVVNLIGCEDFALLLRQHDSDRHAIILANGPTGRRPMVEVLGDPRVAEAVRMGMLQVAGPDQPPEAAVAAVPLFAGSQAVGVLVIGQLLPQKPRLVPLDLEIFELLGQQVAGRLLSGIAQRRVNAGIPAFDLGDFEGVSLAALPSHGR